MKLRAYLDNNATTQLASEALAAMMPYLTDNFLNASSAAGELAGAAAPIIAAKKALAALFGDEDYWESFYLTSGASEANSWAVHSATSGHGRGTLVSTQIEHPSLLAALHAKEEAGWTVALAAPDRSGLIHADRLRPMLSNHTMLVTVMLANNETGVLQPLEEIFELVATQAPSALLHVDATQAVGRVPLDLDGNLAGADLVSLSAHKFHGPKGCGALYAAPGVDVKPLIHGSQQDGRRGGTSDVASAAGLAAAARFAADGLSAMPRVVALRDRFEEMLQARLPNATFVGKDAPRLPNTSCFIVPGVDSNRLVEALALEGIVIASGAACTSGAPRPSHVLTAMGISQDEAGSALRVSLSHWTQWPELELALEAIAERVLALA